MNGRLKGMQFDLLGKMFDRSASKAANSSPYASFLPRPVLPLLLQPLAQPFIIGNFAKQKWENRHTESPEPKKNDTRESRHNEA
jgi:hypothetical protein